ncbi:Uncharacterised protein [Corynebacterium renale]|uniref:Small integral membrane protein DUF2273 n=1 Tax=Corynebacterium renale TaxID=1724 RepID=A0A2A9DKX1_9CORY|nr:hypothetical protein [Corynebacterium renale]PFG27244.1 hypothetical protein ATK06_0295 [Corynebacterium renale]SQG64023.1 Uncharacterised protein [Corynebacterium renale]SQI23671.1 Uncharacterised protein [Corynebacterium renale]STD03644.1 Uncharacterised protein [Corynebacterium renale]
MKNYTVIGLFAGLALAFAVILGGVSGFFWALFFGIIGTIVGLQLDGRIDVRALLDSATSNRGGRG